jgi:hypothetical protein
VSQPVGNLTFATDLSVYRDQIIDITRPECANEIDDDGDTFVDWPDDPNCVSELGLTELPPPAVPALQGLGFWLLTGVLGLIGITRLRKRSRA